MLCKILNDYISDDTLLYFNLWVISRGKDFYLQVLANPSVSHLAAEGWAKNWEEEARAKSGVCTDE